MNKCHECGEEFSPKKINTKYCLTCRGIYHKPVVYIAQVGGGNEVKIGFSKCLRIRLKQLALEFKSEIKLISCYSSTYEIEKKIHEKLFGSAWDLGRESYVRSPEVMAVFFDHKSTPLNDLGVMCASAGLEPGSFNGGGKLLQHGHT